MPSGAASAIAVISADAAAPRPTAAGAVAASFSTSRREINTRQRIRQPPAGYGRLTGHGQDGRVTQQRKSGRSLRPWMVWGTGLLAYVVAVLDRTTFGVSGLDAAERFSA